MLGSQLERYLWLSQARYGWEFLTHPGVLLIIGMIVVTLVIPMWRARKRKAEQHEMGEAAPDDTPAMHLWGTLFSLFFVGVLGLALSIALDWPLRSAMMIYWLAGIGVPLCLAQIWFDLRQVRLGGQGLGPTLAAPLSSTGGQRTWTIFGWIFALLAGVLAVGFHLTIPVFIFAYVRTYGGSWREAIVLTLFAMAFLIGAFDMLITVLWPTPFLLELFGLEYPF